MEWNVYYYNINRRIIMQENILVCQKDFLKKLRKKAKDESEFVEELRLEMLYYYWGKCEWELMIRKDGERYFLTPFPPHEGDQWLDVTEDASFPWAEFYARAAERLCIDEDGIKFDVYMQLQYRWDDFVQYCWANTKPSGSRKKRTSPGKSL